MPVTARAKSPTLYLIDGYAQFFRAYHAIRTPMTSPVTKEPTNMSFGFIGMLLKLLRGGGKIAEEGGKPDYVAVALDVSGDRGTFRSQIYEDYKANRPPPPEDLFPQVERCLAMMRSMRIPLVGVEGFEADDCIATMVTSLRQKHPDLRVRVISKDKDLKQLLAEGEVEMFDIHTDLVITVGTLREEFGITPRQVIDMLSLMGDTVDNVPGVEGVGPKTAAKLVAEHGSVEAVLAAAAKGAIKGKLGERLKATRAEDLELSKRLVSLRHDVPIEFDLGAAEVKRFDLAAMGPVLKELGFNRYQDELKALMGGTPVAAAGPATAPVTRTTVFQSPGEGGGLFATPRGGKEVTEEDLAGMEAGAERSREAASKSGRRAAAAASGASHLPPGGLFEAITGGAFSQRPLIAPQSGDYRAIATAKELKWLVEELRSAECIAVDTETTGLSPLRCKLCGISLSTKIGTGVYIPVRSPDPASHLDEQAVLDALRPILESPAIAKCGHNLKYDMLVLRNHGVRIRGLLEPASSARGSTGGDVGEHEDAHIPSSLRRSVAPSQVFDSMIASFLIDASRSSHGLDSLALALLGRTNIHLRDLIGSGPEERTFDQVPLDQAVQYAAEDADVALQLRAVMLPQLTAMGLMPLFTRVEMPLVEVLAELEFNGIHVDPAELDRQRLRLQKRIDELRRQIADASMEAIGRTFNPDSPRQLAAALFNKPGDDESGLGLKPIKRIKTGYSTDAEVLEKLAQDPEIGTPIPGLIVEHRELTKLVNTYLVSLVEEINSSTRRIHSSFNQTVAVTGRLASSDPNLQNIPIRTDIGREIRRAFVAEPGNVLVSADYSQIELRLLAHLSRDPALIKAFHEGQDIHTAVAAQIHHVPVEQVTKAQRNGAKMVNFGIVYGITPFGLARRLGVSNTEATEIIDGYKRRFAGITTFLQECIEQAKRTGYVETMLKRRRPLPEIESSNPARRAFAERNAINSVVQGSAADLIKIAMVEIQAGIEGEGIKASRDQGIRAATAGTDLGLRMLLQIHDELVFECPRSQAEAAKAMIVHRMEHAMEISVPLRVDASISENWYDGK